jgi:mannose-1-phosphate guanylyltransferase/mannose-1-phosphate guanylyltransferase/mannose-6-phosphate isomerase
LPPIGHWGCHLDHVVGQLPDPATSQIIVEPGQEHRCGHCPGGAAPTADGIMLVCPSDHHIGDPAAFRPPPGLLPLAADDWLVSFGIAATAPETGFGYLKQGDAIDGTAGHRRTLCRKARSATRHRLSCRWRHSTGTAASSPSARHFLAELERHRPDIASAVRASVEKAVTKGNAFHPDPVGIRQDRQRIGGLMR